MAKKSAEAKEKETTRRHLVELRKKMITEIFDRLNRESARPRFTEVGDEADLANDDWAREMSLLFTNREKEKLSAIEEAIQKLNENTYGVCERCGREIQPGRLRVLPLAKYCIECQSAIEKESPSAERQAALRYPELRDFEESEE
jgi:DnaK suppressor protein